MNHALRKEMERYSDERILNNIRQHYHFSTISVSIAKEIALQRGLMNQQQIESFNRPLSVNTPNALSGFNQSNSFPPPFPSPGDPPNPSISRRTYAQPSYQASRQNNSSNTTGAVITAIVVILFIVKIIVRLAMYNN